MSLPRNGLCDSCTHQQLVPNTRGSVFSLCLRSRNDPAYPRYPRVPVLACPGYEERRRSGGGDQEGGEEAERGGVGDGGSSLSEGLGHQGVGEGGEDGAGGEAERPGEGVVADPLEGGVADDDGDRQ